jgi:hypothetical protein
MNPVSPYAGQSQQQQIAVPRTIVFKSYQYSPEESCWAMPPYASFYPPGSQQPGEAFVPPPVQMTDLFSAMQMWPLPQSG